MQYIFAHTDKRRLALKRSKSLHYTNWRKEFRPCLRLFRHSFLLFFQSFINSFFHPFWNVIFVKLLTNYDSPWNKEEIMRLKNLKTCHVLDLRSISSALILLCRIKTQGKLREVKQTKRRKYKLQQTLPNSQGFCFLTAFVTPADTTFFEQCQHFPSTTLF
jgi:hypothetical protein